MCGGDAELGCLGDEGTHELGFEHRAALVEDALAQVATFAEQLAKLPDDTRIYPGHDYGATPTSTIGEQRGTNPYLRCASPEIRKVLGMENATDAQVFAEIRERKNRF